MSKVILLHGAGANASQMRRLERALEAQGFMPIAISYESDAVLSAMIAELAAKVKEVPLAGKTHVVGHSMGGLLGRAVVMMLPEAHRGRLVQIASPNRGAERIGWIPRPWMVRRHVSQGYFEIARGSPSLDLLPVPTCEVGIVCGTRRVDLRVPTSLGILAASLVFRTERKEPSDGAVSFGETDLPGMRDRISLPYAHDWLPQAKETAVQVGHFLRMGAFRR